MEPSQLSRGTDPSSDALLPEPKLVKASGWNRWWPQRIGRRLAVGFGALVVLMLLALSQAGLQLRLVSDVTRQFATGDMQRLLRVQSGFERDPA